MAKLSLCSVLFILKHLIMTTNSQIAPFYDYYEYETTTMNNVVVDVESIEPTPENQKVEDTTIQHDILNATAEPIEPISSVSDVLDTVAWSVGWMLTVSLYAGRQDRSRTFWQTSIDLPKIYIPNELNGNEINRALSLTTKSQAVAEANEFIDYLDFFVGRRDSYEDLGEALAMGYWQIYNVDKRDGQFVLSKELINDTQTLLNDHNIDQELISVVIDAAQGIHWPIGQVSSYEALFSVADQQYSNLMTRLNMKNIVLWNSKDQTYTITKKGSELILIALKTNLLSPSQLGYWNVDNYYFEYRAYHKYLDRLEIAIGTSLSTINLPANISWGAIKQAIQTTYAEAIGQVHLFQFLPRTMDYLNVDPKVEGMSKLSSAVTQMLVNAMSEYVSIF